MSEVLRAILDHNSIDSRPAIYSILFTVAAPATGLAIGRRTASLTCKADTYFLVQGATQDNAVFDPAGTNSWATKAFPSTFQIQRGNNNEPFSISPQLMVLQNYNLNNLATMDEYILFDPLETLTFTVDMRVGAASVQSAFDFVTLVGIEYQMPEGMRLNGYG